MSRIAKAVLRGMGRTLDVFGTRVSFRRPEALRLARETELTVDQAEQYLDWRNVGDDLRAASMRWTTEADGETESRAR